MTPQFIENNNYVHSRLEKCIEALRSSMIGDWLNLSGCAYFDTPEDAIKILTLKGDFFNNEDDEAKDWRKLKEIFVKKVCIESASLIIILLSKPSFYEQVNLENLSNYLDKPIIAIHDFYQLKGESDLIDFIETYILKGFDVFEMSPSIDAYLLDPTKTDYKLKYYVNRKVYHLVYVNESYDWAYKYNDPTIEFLKKGFIAINKQLIDPKQVIKNNAKIIFKKCLDYNKEIIFDYFDEKKAIKCCQDIKKPILKPKKELKIAFNPVDNKELYEFQVLSQLIEDKNKKEVFLNLDFILFLPKDPEVYNIQYEIEEPQQIRKSLRFFLKIQRFENKEKVIIEDEKTIPITLEKNFLINIKNDEINEFQKKFEPKNKVSRKMLRIRVHDYEPTLQNIEPIIQNKSKIVDETKGPKFNYLDAFDKADSFFQNYPTNTFDKTFILDFQMDDIAAYQDDNKKKIGRMVIIQNHEKLKDAKIIMITGRWREGKTFLIKKLSGSSILEKTFSQNDEGFNIKTLKELNSYIIEVTSGGRFILKNSGENSFSENEKKYKLIKRKIHEALILRFCRKISKSFVYVMNKLTSEDDENIKDLIDHLKTNILFVIHNYSDVGYEMIVRQKVRHLKKAYNLIEKEMVEMNSYEFENKNIFYYEGVCENKKGKSIKIYHIVFAQEGTEAGFYYNETGLLFLKFHLSLNENILYQSKINFESEFKTFIGKNLFKYFESDQNIQWQQKKILPVLPFFNNDKGKVFQFEVNSLKPHTFWLNSTSLLMLNYYEPEYNIIDHRKTNGELSIELELYLLGPKYLYSSIDYKGTNSNNEFHSDEDYFGCPKGEVWEKDNKNEWNVKCQPKYFKDEIVLLVTGFRKLYDGSAGNDNITKEVNNIKFGAIKIQISLKDHLKDHENVVKILLADGGKWKDSSNVFHFIFTYILD